MRRTIATEHQEQVTLIQWWDTIGARAHGVPVRRLFAIPNAGAGAQRGQAGKLKAEGVRKGILDLFLAVPRRGRGGLFLEMKRREEAALSPEQRETIDDFSSDYRCVVAYGADQAINAIKDYLA